MSPKTHIIKLQNITCNLCESRIKTIYQNVEGILHVQLNTFLKELFVRYNSKSLNAKVIEDKLKQNGFVLEQSTTCYLKLFIFTMVLFVSHSLLYHFMIHSQRLFLEMMFSFLVNVLLTRKLMMNHFDLENMMLYSSLLSFICGLVITCYDRYDDEASSFFMISTTVTAFVIFSRFLIEQLKNSSTRFLCELRLKVKNKLNTSTTDMKQGSLVLLKDNEEICFDGIVAEGLAYVDESNITGEIKQIRKITGSRIFAGTILKKGNIKAKVLSMGQKTYYAEILRVLNSSTFMRHKKMYYYFSKFVAVLSVSVFIVYFSLGLFGIPGILYQENKPVLFVAFKTAISTLVIACPCVLSISAPLSYLVLTQNLFNSGIILKDPEQILNFNRIKTVFFDKTGTLTKCRTEVASYILYYRELEEFTMSLLKSIEMECYHPIAEAIRELVKDTATVELHDITYISGCGLRAVDKTNTEVCVGTKDFIVKNIEALSNKLGTKCNSNIETINRAVSLGVTQIYLSYGTKILIALEIKEAIREGALELMSCLHKNNIETILLTGDSEVNARHVANALGISKVYFKMTAKDKADVINQYKTSTRVAMIGDGMNDAAAFKCADLSISINHLNDSASLILLTPELGKISLMLTEIKRTVNRIWINYSLSFAYNMVAFPAVTGLLIPFNIMPNVTVSCLCMLLSSLSVGVSSLLLKKHRH